MRAIRASANEIPQANTNEGSSARSLQTARASDYTAGKRKRKGKKGKKEIERVLKTVLPNKRPNFIDVTADAVYR